MTQGECTLNLLYAPAPGQQGEAWDVAKSYRASHGTSRDVTLTATEHFPTLLHFISQENRTSLLSHQGS